MLCCICKEPGHLGANCDYSWVFPTVHGAPTDESEIVNIEDEPQHSPSTDVNIEDDQQDSLSIDENLPLASVLPPPTQSAEQPIHPSPEQPVSDLTAQPLLEQSKEFNQPDPLSEQSAQPSQPSTCSSQSEQPVQSPQTSDCTSSPLGQSSEPTPTDSPLITSQGLIASIKSVIKPPPRRTPAKLSLACFRKPTTPTLVPGKPRSSIPVPTASHTPPLVTPDNPEEDMETTHELKRKSSELSTPTSERKNGRNRSTKSK
ncbi:increased rDNA silencing protein 4-like [Stylophora pistillata]|nr:increased rDNA silencing protein 4-like [Stylophora pistillata]